MADPSAQVCDDFDTTKTRTFCNFSCISIPHLLEIQSPIANHRILLAQHRVVACLEQNPYTPKHEDAGGGLFGGESPVRNGGKADGEQEDGPEGKYVDGR